MFLDTFLFFFNRISSEFILNALYVIVDGLIELAPLGEGVSASNFVDLSFSWLSL